MRIVKVGETGRKSEVAVWCSYLTGCKEEVLVSRERCLDRSLLSTQIQSPPGSI